MTVLLRGAIQRAGMLIWLPGRAGLATVLGIVPWVCADQIVLSNGRVLEGLIVRETAQAIVLDLGAGTINLRRSQVASILRSSEEENSRLWAQWQQRYFLHRKFVPPTMQALADGLRELLAMRESAKVAQGDLATSLRDERRVLDDIAELRRRLAVVSARLHSTPLPTDSREVRTYNAVVAENNQLILALGEEERKMASIRGRQEELQRRLSDYAQKLAAFESQFAEAVDRHRQEVDPEGSRFLEQTAVRLRDLCREFSVSPVRLDCEGGHARVQATLNGRTTVRLLVDTGATLVSLSETSARLAGLSTNGMKEVTVGLADGTRARGWLVTLESLQVGRERVDGVPAVVLCQMDGENAGGLLGMSFLRHFLVEYDPRACRLVLRRFAPE